MKEREMRGFFPKVVTNEEQKRFVYQDLIPALKRKRLIKEESFAECFRYLMEKGAAEVGMTAPVLDQRIPGRKIK